MQFAYRYRTPYSVRENRSTCGGCGSQQRFGKRFPIEKKKKKKNGKKRKHVQTQRARSRKINSYPGLKALQTDARLYIILHTVCLLYVERDRLPIENRPTSKFCKFRGGRKHVHAKPIFQSPVRATNTSCLKCTQR